MSVKEQCDFPHASYISVWNAYVINPYSDLGGWAIRGWKKTKPPAELLYTLKNKRIRLYSRKSYALTLLDLYYANADDIGVTLQPVKIKHMACHC